MSVSLNCHFTADALLVLLVGASAGAAAALLVTSNPLLSMEAPIGTSVGTPIDAPQPAECIVIPNGKNVVITSPGSSLVSVERALRKRHAIQSVAE